MLSAKPGLPQPAPPSTAAPEPGDEPSARRSLAGPDLWEVWGVWLFCAALVLAVFVTYARVPAHELNHGGRGGLVGGASRAVTVLNFPVALVALPLLGIVVARLLASAWAADRRRRPAIIGVALVALGLCAVTVWPGVVREDAVAIKPINALPVLGVALVLALTLVATRVCGMGGLLGAAAATCCGW